MLLSDLSIRRPVFATMMMATLVILGIVGYQRLGIDEYPDITYPVVIVQVVANPLISLLGPPQTAHSRLTFAQAFNSLGTTIFPIIGAAVILGSLANVTADQLTGAELQAYRAAESEARRRTSASMLPA